MHRHTHAQRATKNKPTDGRVHCLDSIVFCSVAEFKEFEMTVICEAAAG